MAKWLVEFYQDLGDEMPGPYRAIAVEAEDADRAQIEAMKAIDGTISKLIKCTDLDESDNKAKSQYYEDEYNPFTKTGHYNGD